MIYLKYLSTTRIIPVAVISQMLRIWIILYWLKLLILDCSKFFVHLNFFGSTQSCKSQWKNDIMRRHLVYFSNFKIQQVRLLIHLICSITHFQLEKKHSFSSYPRFRPRHHHPHTKVITSYIMRKNVRTHEWLNEPKLLAAFYEHRLTDTHQCSLTWSHCMYAYIFFLI